MKPASHLGTPRIVRYSALYMRILATALFALVLSCNPSTPPEPVEASVPNSTADASDDAADDAAEDASDETGAPKLGLVLDAKPTVTFEVHFSPKGGCADAIVAMLNGAKKTIRVQAYGFTAPALADALVRAKNRGVDVQMVLDRSDLLTPQLTEKTAVLKAANIPLLYDMKHVIAHNKVMIVDGMKTETGSYNYTAVAESGNAENCPIFSGSAFAALYNTNWEAHKAHSVSAPADAGVPEAGSGFH